MSDSFLTISTIKDSLRRDEQKCLTVDESWYLLSMKWYEEWRQLVAEDHHRNGDTKEEEQQMMNGTCQHDDDTKAIKIDAYNKNDTINNNHDDNNHNHNSHNHNNNNIKNKSTNYNNNNNNKIGIFHPVDNSSLIDHSIHLTYSYSESPLPNDDINIRNGSEQNRQRLLQDKIAPNSPSFVYSNILRPNLSESIDFIKVSKETWELLIKTYGCKGDIKQQTIERRVIPGEKKTLSKNQIELYPYVLRLFKIDVQTGMPDVSSETLVLVSKRTLLCDLKRIGYYALGLFQSESKRSKMIAEHDLDAILERDLRIWDFLTNDTVLIDNSKMNLSLEEMQFEPNQRVLFEVPINDVWPLDRLYQLQRQDMKSTQDVSTTCSTSSEENTSLPKKKKRPRLNFNIVSYIINFKSRLVGRNIIRSVETVNHFTIEKRGLCGLRNLGNTCFMNSALQCLSNTVPLAEYFLSDKYMQDINKVNPLGLKGKLAKEFAALLKEMWSGATCIAPINFKYAIGQFAPQFSGFAQHDSQELIAYLLDGLHEDLNLVKKKPVIEVVESNGRPDEEMAIEAWHFHLMRNKSIIVDLFQGQLKSTLKCPTCERISIKFDPFMYLSVPIPHTSTIIMSIIMMEDLSLRPKKYCLELSLNQTVGALTQKFAYEFGFKNSKLIFADMVGYKINSILDPTVTMNIIAQKKQILCFKLPEKQFVEIRVAQRYNPQDGSPKVPCGIPFILFLDLEITARQLYETIWNHIQRYSNAFSVLQEQSKDGELIRIPFDPNSKCFSLYLANERGEQCGNENCQNIECESCPIYCNDEKFMVPRNRTVIVEWCNASDFNSKEAMTVNLDPSVNNCHERMNRQITLEDCLNLFSEIEQLGPNDPWYCPSCKEFKQAYKKFEIWSAPEILCIHLKRFIYDRRYRERIDKYVEFPIERMDMSRFMVRRSKEPLLYDLFAISNHIGSLGGGHYIAYAKNRIDGKWYCFDDSSCSQVTEDSLRSSSAYLLFYRRRRTDEPADITVHLELPSN
jgi:ubiquitin C-terminal hydrolase